MKAPKPIETPKRIAMLAAAAAVLAAFNAQAGPPGHHAPPGPHAGRAEVRIPANPDMMMAHMRVASGQIQGWVVGVNNGHTLSIVDDQQRQHEVILAGIESPYSTCASMIWKEHTVRQDASCKENGQAFGKAAKAALATVAYGRFASVALTGEIRDARPVGTVYVDSGVDVALAQVANGYAWALPGGGAGVPAPVADLYSFAQTQARSHRAGLWIEQYPVAPWEYRARFGYAPLPGEAARITYKLPTEKEPLPGQMSVSVQSATVRDFLGMGGINIPKPDRIGFDARDVRNAMVGHRQPDEPPRSVGLGEFFSSAGAGLKKIISAPADPAPDPAAELRKPSP